MQRCKLCLLPGAAPGADLDVHGVCRLCSYHDPKQRVADELLRERHAQELEDTLQSCRGGRGEYDALVCLSGGKDSLYLLHRVCADYKLKVLAFTTDVAISGVAWRNIRRMTAALGCDHLVYRPAEGFYRKLYRALLQNQEARGAAATVSAVVASLFEGDALRVATDKGIPLVLAGNSPGQRGWARRGYEISRRLICDTDWTPPALRSLAPAEQERFWNPHRYVAGTAFPRFLAPFHAWPYDADEAMRAVQGLGLVARACPASALRSGSIHWLLMYSDLKHFGFNPYAPAYAALIREGQAERRHWKLLAPAMEFMVRHKLLLGRAVVRQLQWLELSESALQITLPQGAYDPLPQG